MPSLKVSVLRICSAVFLLAVVACAPMTKVKEVAADKTGYMNKHFSVQSIGVANKLAGNAVPTENFRELKVSFSLESAQVDGKKTSFDGLDTFFPVGNGFVQQMTEYSTNGISINLFYTLKYGVLSLRWQTVPLQGSIAAPMFEIKKVSKFDPVPTHAGQEFNLEFSTGHAQTVSTQPVSQWVCKTIKASPASAMHPKLKGQAIEVNCEITNGDVGAVSGRTTWIFLESYGVPIVIESVTAAGKSVHKITEIKIES